MDINSHKQKVSQLRGTITVFFCYWPHIYKGNLETSSVTLCAYVCVYKIGFLNFLFPEKESQDLCPFWVYVLEKMPSQIQEEIPNEEERMVQVSLLWPWAHHNFSHLPSHSHSKNTGQHTAAERSSADFCEGTSQNHKEHLCGTYRNLEATEDCPNYYTPKLALWLES